VVAAHLALAAGAAVLTVAVGLAALAAIASTRPLRRLIDRLILAVLVVVGIAIASGLLLLVTGHGPTDPLHLLYAVAAFVALPVARFAVPSIRTQRRMWILVVGAVVLLGLFVRLLQTG
jgi:ABC-type Fe3+ transport system permease subunit